MPKKLPPTLPVVPTEQVPTTFWSFLRAGWTSASKPGRVAMGTIALVTSGLGGLAALLARGFLWPVGVVVLLGVALVLIGWGGYGAWRKQTQTLNAATERLTSKLEMEPRHEHEQDLKGRAYLEVTNLTDSATFAFAVLNTIEQIDPVGNVTEARWVRPGRLAWSPRFCDRSDDLSRVRLKTRAELNVAETIVIPSHFPKPGQPNVSCDVVGVQLMTVDAPAETPSGRYWIDPHADYRLDIEVWADNAERGVRGRYRLRCESVGFADELPQAAGRGWWSEGAIPHVILEPEPEGDGA